MSAELLRRDFLKWCSTGTAICLAGFNQRLFATPGQLVSPGCRTSKVKVARVYVANPAGLWPKPDLDFKAEIKKFETEFARRAAEFDDVEFMDALVTSPEQLPSLAQKIKECDGVLAIHLSLNTGVIFEALLKMDRPTMIFALPYSGHEWASFGKWREQPLGKKMECLLTSDFSQLVIAVRPFRAIHHLREAKILNLTTRSFSDYAASVKSKFGTTAQAVELDRVIALYNTISDKQAQNEMEKWIREAEAVIEPSHEEIRKSCKLALAMEKLLDEENATCLTIDCYGTMWDKTIKLPAYPCLGFTRLNNMGYGGICESDLSCAMTHIIFQGLTGKPGFISDPTVDESRNSIILAHCLGTSKMGGPNNPPDSYKIRSVMERQEGVVPQVKMRTGQKVTQAILTSMDQMIYFTGTIIDAPVSIADDRGCRTKIEVEVDGDATKLWHNWAHGLHRQTCYGDISRELTYFSRFTEINLVNEAV